MQATQIWQAALLALSRNVPRGDFDTWLKTSTIVAFEDGAVVVAMPNSFAVHWIESRHAELVQRTLSEIVGYPVLVRFAIREDEGYFIPGGSQAEIPVPGQAPYANQTAATQSQVAEGAGAFGRPAVLADGSPHSEGTFYPYTQPSPEVQGVMPYPNTPGQLAGQTATNGYGAGRNGSSLPANGYGNGARPTGTAGSPGRFNSANVRELPNLGEQVGSDGLSLLNPKYLFEHFIVGSSNRMAHAASLAVADNPAHAYNPLFLYGGVGLGKTHLLHAIGHHAMAKFPGIRVVYVSSEKFTNDMINAIRDGTNEEFRNRYRSIDILMIDDIQFIAGKEGTQEEFFHTFNALHGAGRQIVISSDRPPKAILTLEDRLRSRFEGGLIADIQPPDLETRMAILRVKGESQQIPVPSDVIDYVAHKIQSNIRELEGALNRIIAYAMLNQKPLTVEVASMALNDLAANNRRRSITPTRVIETVASFYSMDIAELKAKTRSRDVVVPRQIAMYIIREETDTSLTDIGAEFGNRDHTTVMHACEKIERAREVDNQIRQAVLAIRQMLYGEMVS